MTWHFYSRAHGVIRHHVFESQGDCIASWWAMKRAAYVSHPRVMRHVN